jgi:membrane fusion protein, multidrug efflux system
MSTSTGHTRTTTRTTWRKGLVSGAVMALAVALAGACAKAPAAGPAMPPPAVTVAAVEARNVTEWEEFSGRLEAVQAVDIRPRVTGYIEKVAFAEGSEVKAGDLLFAIDQRPYRTELARAQGELAQAVSGAGLAGRDQQRAQALLAADAITRQDFDRAASAAERGGGTVQAARAAVASARLNLTWTEVRSPISGRVGRAEVTRGNLVQAGAPGRLTSVVSLDPIYVSFEVDERTYLKYAALARQAGGGRDTRAVPVHLGLSNEDGFPHKGKLQFVDNQIDPRTATVRMRAVFANPDRLFAPGLFARLRLEGGAERRATLIADRAVGTDQDKKFVLVLKPDSTVEYRPVQLGRLVDGYRVVTGGLAAGERIVVAGLQHARPGMKVTAKVGPMLASAAAEAPIKAASR